MTFVENHALKISTDHRFYLASPAVRPRCEPTHKCVERILDDLADRKLPTARMFFFGHGQRSCAIGGPKGAMYLTDHETRFLLLLLGSKLPKTWNDVSETIWPDPDEMPDCWLGVIRTKACIIRRKLKMIGAEFQIATKHGEGFYIARSGAA